MEALDRTALQIARAPPIAVLDMKAESDIMSCARIHPPDRGNASPVTVGAHPGISVRRAGKRSPDPEAAGSQLGALR